MQTPSPTIQLLESADQSHTGYSERYGQTYHSEHGALTEALQVYLTGCHIQHRLASGRSLRVLEIGFGLALNALLSFDCAETTQTPLHYVGLEHDPINHTILRSLHYDRNLTHTALVDDVGQLLDQLNTRSANCAELATTPISVQGNIGQQSTLVIHRCDATAWLQTAAQQPLAPENTFDAIYLDAFSPDVNPECWSVPFFEHLHQVLADDGILATYCVKGLVRRNLRSAQFHYEKHPGPPGKREVLTAKKAHST